MLGKGESGPVLPHPQSRPGLSASLKGTAVAARGSALELAALRCQARIPGVHLGFEPETLQLCYVPLPGLEPQPTEPLLPF